MSRSSNYIMLTQVQQRLKAEGKDPNNISLLSRETNLSRPTVRKYLKNGFVEHKNTGRKRGSLLDPFKEFLHEQFSEHGNYNSKSLHRRLVELGYTGGITILREYVRRFRPPRPSSTAPVRTMRYETKLGEQAQMDWGCVYYRVGKRKELKKLACFVMILGASRMRYVEFFTSARQENLFIGMTNAFKYFGGVPHTVLTDNMKSVVHKRSKVQIIFNPKYEYFMAEYGFSTVLCRIRAPETKGKVERLIHFIKDSFFPGRTFITMADLNVQSITWCDTVNAEEHGTTGLIPSEVLIQEREHLKPLPSQSVMDQYLWLSRTVSFDGMISYEGKTYGIVHSCMAKSVKVKRDGPTIFIIDETGKLVGEYTPNPEQKTYYHPRQCASDYVGSRHPAAPSYGIAIQQEGVETLFLSEESNLSEYDVTLGGSF